MKGPAIFRETDVGFTAAQMTLVVKTMAGAVIDTTTPGTWTMTESQRGSYEINVPGLVVDGTVFMFKTDTPSIKYDGFLTADATVDNQAIAVAVRDVNNTNPAPNSLGAGINSIATPVVTVSPDYPSSITYRPTTPAAGKINRVIMHSGLILDYQYDAEGNLTGVVEGV